MKPGQYAVFWTKGLMDDVLHPEPRKIKEILHTAGNVAFEERKHPFFVEKWRVIATFDEYGDAIDTIRLAQIGWDVQTVVVNCHHDLWLRAKEQRAEAVAEDIRAMARKKS